MARWYATFDGSTISALEAASNGFRRQRVAFPGSPGGTVRRNTLLSTRQALSDAFYAQIDPANRNGALGVVVPRDAITDGGSTLSGTTLYRNAAAIWPTNPVDRPTSEILISNSNTPTADAWSIDKTLYTNAQAAVEACVTDLGVRNRLGNNPFRTLASLHHDHELTYLAWDDFTPGQIAAGNIAANVTTGSVIVTGMIPANLQYPADAEAEFDVQYALTVPSLGGSGNRSGLTTRPPGSTGATFTLSPAFGGGDVGRTYDIRVFVTFRYTSPFTSEGVTRIVDLTGSIGAA